MAPEDDTSLSLSLVNACKPQFFKVLFPDPYANLMIPRKFHVNLPHKLPKLATLFSPTKKFWHVEICRIDEDLYIQNGWSEFAKVHDLQTGYLMVFRYEGNMIFKVKIFDTTGCLKDYSLGLGSLAKHAEARIKSETSSDTRNQTSSKSSQGVLKKRKLANEQAAIDKREKGSTSQVTVQVQVQEKKKPVTSFDSTTCSKQFEKIIRPYCFSRGFLGIPKEFCVNNGLLTRRTVHLKISSLEGRSWPVHFNLKALQGTLGKGWNKFREAAKLNEGDRCIFRLVSQNSFSVDVVPRESNLTGERKGKGKGKAIEGSTSSDIALDLEEKHCSRPILEWESAVRQYNLKYSYQSLAKAFCLDNNLTSTRNVTLRDLRGKEWCAKFYMCQYKGRLSRKGWTEFSREYGLEIGDRCIFKLIEKDTLLVRVVKKEEDKALGRSMIP